MDCAHKLKTPDDINANNNARDYGYKYLSIIGNGHGSIISDFSEKIEALNHLMNHQTGRNFEFSDEKVNGVTVFKIVMDSFTGKGRR